MEAPYHSIELSDNRIFRVTKSSIFGNRAAVSLDASDGDGIAITVNNFCAHDLLDMAKELRKVGEQMIRDIHDAE